MSEKHEGYSAWVGKDGVIIVTKGDKETFRTRALAIPEGESNLVIYKSGVSLQINLNGKILEQYVHEV